MCLKNALIIIFCLVSGSLFSQILVDDVGDGWKSQVDSALRLIEVTSPEHWCRVKENCSHITYWLGNFSTTTDSSTIMISVKDMKLNSINNLASVIVHESHHLYLKKRGIVLIEREEEYQSYLWEAEFVWRLNNPEAWLKLHIVKCLKIYKE
jgi:hypothetical protein